MGVRRGSARSRSHRSGRYRPGRSHPASALLALALAGVWVAGCASGESGSDAGGPDARTGFDAGAADGGEALDAGRADANGRDAGPPDAGRQCEGVVCPPFEFCNEIGECETYPSCTAVDAGGACAEGTVCRNGYCVPREVDVDGDGSSAGQDCDEQDAQVHPDAADVCNGVDDDCDPMTDDGADDPSLGQACDGDDSDQCEDDALECVDGALSCSPGDDVLDVCNGLDDDCDPASLDGEHDPLLGAACDGPDSDSCEDDLLECVDGGLTCSGGTDGLELCNGVDDDCDPSTPDGADEPTLGEACDGSDSDQCLDDMVVCLDGGLACSASDDDLELCNGMDDDCDPSTPDGADEPTLGEACDGADSDMCEDDAVICRDASLSCSLGDDTIEVCNGLDDDCSGTADDADPAAMCADDDTGDVCVSGSCECTPGTYDLDPSVPNCECAADPAPGAGGSCGAGAIDLGDLSDAGDLVTVGGNLVPEGRVVWYRFNAVDTADSSCDEFHVRVFFRSNPGGQFRLRVLRGGCAGGNEICGGNTDFEWFTDFANAGLGECPCSPSPGAAGVNVCNDQTAVFYLAVQRAAGAELSCDSYSIEISNGVY